MIDLMGAAGRVPGPVAERLHQYTEMVDQGEGASEQAKALRAELERALPQDTRLHQADLEMQKRALLARIGGGTS